MLSSFQISHSSKHEFEVTCKSHCALAAKQTARTDRHKSKEYHYISTHTRQHTRQYHHPPQKPPRPKRRLLTHRLAIPKSNTRKTPNPKCPDRSIAAHIRRRIILHTEPHPSRGLRKSVLNQSCRRSMPALPPHPPRHVPSLKPIRSISSCSGRQIYD